MWTSSVWETTAKKLLESALENPRGQVQFGGHLRAFQEMLGEFEIGGRDCAHTFEHNNVVNKIKGHQGLSGINCSMKSEI